MNPEALLTQLRNLDAPAALSWWPPALGWWILASLIIAATLIGILLAVKIYRGGAAARIAEIRIADAHTKYLQCQNSTESKAIFLQEVNSILKRLAANFEGADRVAGLTGQAWRTYLSEIAPDLNATELEPFSSAIYQAQPQIDVDEVMFSLDILVNQLRVRYRA